ncbi:MAG TPA: hypothetical protein VFH73_06960, partial [Polyangia bacterium]|nr:hypothetical protein [Polyangia bacterium]
MGSIDKSKTGLRNAGFGLLLVFSAAACGADKDEVGVARIALTQAPTGVACLRLTVDGSRRVVKLFSVTAGQSTVFTVGGLPVGSDTFNGEAFSAACANIGTAAPEWISDPVVATVSAASIVDVILKMKRNGRSGVGFDFDDTVSDPTGAGGSGAIGGTGGTAGSGGMGGTAGSGGMGGTAGSGGSGGMAGMAGSGGSGGSGGTAGTGGSGGMAGGGGTGGGSGLTVASGGSHTCVVLANATVKCWGLNDVGQLGDGTTNVRSNARTVVGLSNVVELVAGAKHTCARLSDA